MDGTVLVADDDSTIRTVLTQALTRAGCKVHATSSLTTLMRWVGEGRGDAVITDVMMPDGNGLEMLPKIAADRPDLPVIVISAQNTIMTAIKASEAEAFDYLPKPFDLPDLMKRTAKALALHRRTPAPRREPVERPEDLPLVGRTPAMQALYRMVAQVLNTDIAVLITGESGTGKSLIARAIHDYSDRRALPLVTVTGSDLHEAGAPARLLDRARGGTVLLDEIRDIPLDLQAHVVHLIDRQIEHPPRFIATSQSDPAGAMEAGKLRSDLYYRLAGATLCMPPLRERVDDIALLAVHFLAHAKEDGAPPRQIGEEAIAVMRKFNWPGNVRQLENTVRRLALSAQAGPVSRAELDAALGIQPGSGSASGLTPPGLAEGDRLSASVARHLQRYFDLHDGIAPPPGLYARILHEIELPLIEIALDACGGNQARCAELLGINRNTLRKKITELDIRVTRRRKLM